MPSGGSGPVCASMSAALTPASASTLAYQSVPCAIPPQTPPRMPAGIASGFPWWINETPRTPPSQRVIFEPRRG